MHCDKCRGTGAASFLPCHLCSPSLCRGSAGCVTKDSACNPLARREPQQSLICFPPAPKASAKGHEVRCAPGNDTLSAKLSLAHFFTCAVKIPRLYSQVSVTLASGAGWYEAAHCRGARGRAEEPSKLLVTPTLQEVPAPPLLLLLRRSRAERGKETYSLFFTSLLLT